MVGREAELSTIDAVLRSAHDQFSALTIEGEPGIGKSTLWGEALARAIDTGFKVLSCRATQAETQLALTGVADLLAPVDTATFATLPEPQRHALDVALLRAAPADRPLDVRTLGTALVSVITESSRSAPVLLAVDDLQWLDRPSTRLLEFALRRLTDSHVAVVATVRAGERDAIASWSAALPPEGTTAMEVGPFDASALSRIVDDQLAFKLSGRLATRIEQATRGNPFAALEIGRLLQRDGERSTGTALPVPEDIRGLVVNRLRSLPTNTQQALARASALARPTSREIEPNALEAAERAGMVVIDANGTVTFAHPLYAEAVYQQIGQPQLRHLHADLASIVSDPEERVRHRALATVGFDDAVAALLDSAATAASGRGAPDVAAELADWSLEKTSSREGPYWMRVLQSARHHLTSGDPARARELAEGIVAGVQPSAIRASANQLIAECSIGTDIAEAVQLLESARADVETGTHQAAEIDLQLSLIATGLLDADQVERCADRALAVAERIGPDGLISAALASRSIARFVGGKGMQVDELERALALEDPDREVAFQIRASMNVAQIYAWTGRIDEARTLFQSLRSTITDRGAETDLPWVLVWLGGVEWMAGNASAATQHIDDALNAADFTQQPVFRAFGLVVRALIVTPQGDLDLAERAGTECLTISTDIGWTAGVAQALYVLAAVDATRGDAAAASARLAPLLESLEAGAVYEWPLAMSVPDGIEALIGTNDLDRAERLLDEFSNFGRRLDRPWVLATSGRSRALLLAARGDLDGALLAAETALIDHERLPLPFERARSLFVLGQLQRRRGERRAARDTFAQAREIFAATDARLWVERAESELRRIGVRRAPSDLTENELRVATLAATGLTNADIATQLFISRRTVESNLARAYRKLGIRSRAELGAVMAERNGSSD